MKTEKPGRKWFDETARYLEDVHRNVYDRVYLPLYPLASLIPWKSRNAATVLLSDSRSGG